MSRRQSIRSCYTAGGTPKAKLSREDAARVQCAYNRLAAPGQVRMSAYECAWCGAWHVGKRTKRSENDKRRDRRARKRGFVAPALHHGGY